MPYIDGDYWTVIYTDGCCFDNGTEDARAGVGVYWPDHREHDISEPLRGNRQTNQRAEIIAAYLGIKKATEEGYENILVRVDSHYVKNAAELWIPKWEANNWRRRITNYRDFRRLADVLDDANVAFQYIQRDRNPADDLAKKGANMH